MFLSKSTVRTEKNVCRWKKKKNKNITDDNDGRGTGACFDQIEPMADVSPIVHVGTKIPNNDIHATFAEKDLMCAVIYFLAGEVPHVQFHFLLCAAHCRRAFNGGNVDAVSRQLCAG